MSYEKDEYLRKLISKFATIINERGFKPINAVNSDGSNRFILSKESGNIWILDKQYDASELKEFDEKNKENKKQSAFLLTDLTPRYLNFFKDISDGSILNYGYLSPSAQEKYIINSRKLINSNNPLIYYSGKEQGVSRFDAYTLKKHGKNILAEIDAKGLDSLKLEDDLLKYVEKY